MDESVVDYFPYDREPLKGREEFVQDNIAFGEIFAGIRSEITNIFGQGDWVCLQGTMTEVHKGTFTLQNGTQIPPTGKQIRIPICNVIRLEHGKIIEVHEYHDQLAFMTQLEAA
jgi:predicted ester cyclase